MVFLCLQVQVAMSQSKVNFLVSARYSLVEGGMHVLYLHTTHGDIRKSYDKHILFTIAE